MHPEEKKLNVSDIQDLFNKVLFDVLESEGEELSPEVIDNLLSKAYKTIDPTLNKIAEEIFHTLRKDQRDAVEDWENFYLDFELSHNELWKNAISSLHALIIASHEVGEGFASKYLKHEKGNKLSVLIALHSRAIQVSNEVLCLLKSGYADGAHARWRTAHEIAVTIDFLAHCSEVTVKKYLEHEAVESYKAMCQYQEYAENLGIAPFSEREIKEIKEIKEELAKKYGKEFLGPYGWAAKKLNIKKPSFYSLESAVGIDHLRPYYRMASHNVHANPKGIQFRLGVSDGAEMFLSGPSNYGLSDPGQSIAITLGRINISLMNYKVNIDSLVYSKVLMKYVDNVQNEFSKIDSIMNEK